MGFLWVVDTQSLTSSWVQNHVSHKIIRSRLALGRLVLRCTEGWATLVGSTPGFDHVLGFSNLRGAFCNSPGTKAPGVQRKTGNRPVSIEESRKVCMA